MELIQQFINRNTSTYQQHSAVSEETIARYDELFKGKFPQELTWIWRNMGFGVFEEGYLQIVNPEEYTFVFEYVDKLLEPAIIWGITALGDLLLWEGNDNWTVAPDEGDRGVFINVRTFKVEMIGHKLRTFLNILVNDEDDLIDTYKAKPYLEMKGKLPKLHYGQCYGYVPALPLGGKASNNNLQVVDAKSYIQVIGQAVGKIVDLG